jgi:hypothetical protein
VTLRKPGKLLLIAVAVTLFGLAFSVTLGPPPGEADGLRQALVDLVRDKDEGERIRLSDAWSGDWDRAAVLGPYSSNRTARKALGFDFGYEAASPWTNTEGGWVVVLAKNRRAVAWFKVPASDLGLYCVKGLVERSADEFTVFRNEGYVGIGPEDGAGRCI